LKHTGAPVVTVHGVKLKKAGWYIEVQFPATTETSSENTPWVIDAEGVVAREVQLGSASNGALWSATTPLFHITSQDAAEAQLS
jgi:hypothetical protein